MRILVVGMADTLALARWCSALTGLRWDIHVFPVFRGHPALEPAGHSLLTGVTYWDPGGVSISRPERDVLVRSALSNGERGLRQIAAWRPDRARLLARLIRRLRPEVVHSMELPHAGYVTLDACRSLPAGARPSWIVSGCGGDVSLFGQLPEHEARIRAVLSAADVYHGECARDVAFARRFGFSGVVGPLTPLGGGWDLDAAAIYRSPGPPSRRRAIALDSSEDWAGRAGTALRALRNCADMLSGYTLEVYPAHDDFLVRARRLAREVGMTVRPIDGRPSPAPGLAVHGRARLSIALGIADGASRSMLEAMIMGALPIQSDTACADEWLEDEVSGFIVPPEDPRAVAGALRRALADDALVDEAARRNGALARERLDFNVVRDAMIALYEGALAVRPCVS